MTTGIVIPAHMASTRFPGKPLAMVGGKPLLSYAVDAARGTGLPWCVATEDEEIVEWCISNERICVMTDHARNGTERAALANKQCGWDRVIVLQCDEPDVTAEDLGILNSIGTDCYTLTCPMGKRDWGNANSVCVRNYLGTGKLFQRGPESGEFNRHVGVYLYKSQTLAEYLNHPQVPCEESLSLEQIRTMAMGYFWSTMKLNEPCRSVNVPEDVEAFK